MNPRYIDGHNYFQEIPAALCALNSIKDPQAVETVHCKAVEACMNTQLTLLAFHVFA